MTDIVECRKCGKTPLSSGKEHCGEVWLWEDMSQSTISRKECQQLAGDYECYEGHCQHRSHAPYICCICGARRKTGGKTPKRTWTDDRGVVHKEY